MQAQLCGPGCQGGWFEAPDRVGKVARAHAVHQKRNTWAGPTLPACARLPARPCWAGLGYALGLGEIAFPFSSPTPPFLAHPSPLNNIASGTGGLPRKGPPSQLLRLALSSSIQYCTRKDTARSRHGLFCPARIRWKAWFFLSFPGTHRPALLLPRCEITPLVALRRFRIVSIPPWPRHLQSRTRPTTSSPRRDHKAGSSYLSLPHFSIPPSLPSMIPVT